jgi:hypothetical protein
MHLNISRRSNLMNNRYLFVILGLITIICSCSEDSKQGSIKKNERYYQTQLCYQLMGEIEHVLFDKTRVDCLTQEYAIEVDWAKKWAEGIGQSLYYAKVTGKRAAVALIVSPDGKDERYLQRLKKVADTFKIKIFVIYKE